MKIVGLTGGIGSGKTTVAGFFQELGIPVYIADIEAKKLTNTSKIIKRKLNTLFGENVYTKEGLNRNLVANKIFNNKELLDQVNAIIHPKVNRHFLRWKKKQKGHYCIKEAAILFENGGYKECDILILVTAPLEIRLQRVQDRDKSTPKEVMARINNQWPDEKKIPLADFIITNLELNATKQQVKKIHTAILKRSP
ncbi:MAG: dephospho-CoA kinase [Flavobacteriaceae bacterium]